MNNDERDEMLWKIAKKRAAFKRSFSVYVFVNTFLIAVWYFSSGPGAYLACVADNRLGFWHIDAIPCCIPGK